MSEVIVIDPSPLPYDVYLLTYQNPSRCARMIERLKRVRLPCTIFDYRENDPRYNKKMHKITVRFFNFIRMFEHFLSTSDKPYALFLEDDVYLRDTIVADLQGACEKMAAHSVECLLVGYLIYHAPPTTSSWGIKPMGGDTGLYSYGEQLWGAQGFILTRDQVKRYVSQYTEAYAWDAARTQMLESDWVFTKPKEKRALMYPPLVVEEGAVSYTNPVQIELHKKCAEFLYDSARYI